jgi:hypothetical protein
MIQALLPSVVEAVWSMAATRNVPAMLGYLPLPAEAASAPFQVILTLDGDSNRLRDHHARADTLRATTTGTRQPLR